MISILHFKYISQLLYRDRKTFSSKVFQVSSSDLVNMGIVVISYTIHDIKVNIKIPLKKDILSRRKIIYIFLLKSNLSLIFSLDI